MQIDSSSEGQAAASIPKAAGGSGKTGTNQPFKDWFMEKPPRDTWVWAAYSLEKADWQIVKTCRHGCCVQTLFGSMVLPNFWRLATAEEGAAEQAEWSRPRKHSFIGDAEFPSRTSIQSPTDTKVERNATEDE